MEHLESVREAIKAYETVAGEKINLENQSVCNLAPGEESLCLQRLIKLERQLIHISENTRSHFEGVLSVVKIR